ncbi:PP2C family protein-serine/threonine phosphatase [bacterium]|nr:PP2C family protein-serine/threonine phosphatase [bacterium]
MDAGTRGTSSLGAPRRLSLKGVLVWALAASVAGLGIGLAIRIFSGAEGSAASALIPMSVVFANVAVFAAVMTVKFVLPKMSGFPAYMRIPLAIVMLIAGGVIGSGIAILINPFVVLYQMRNAVMVATINGAVALAVGLMTYTYDQMRSQIENVVAERSRLEQEMNIARRIQTELLPTQFPELPGWDIFGFSVPARQVGGDCYDVIEMGEGRLAITIGDVSGKGAPAAILMANVQAAVRALAESGIPAAHLVERVNTLVHGYTEDAVFVTFFYAVLNTRTQELTYVNAGHNPPCVLRASGEREYLDKGGLVVGVMPGIKYEQGTVALSIGDDLMLYTDGITEAMNVEEEMFGEERLEQLLVQHRHRSARDIEEHIYTEIVDFAEGAAQADDLTMVIVKRCSANAPTDNEEITETEAFSSSDSPREATGGSSAAQGASDSDRLGGPATAAPEGLIIEGVGTV